MPANIAFAGGNGCNMVIRKGTPMNDLGHTRPIPSPRTVLIERVYRTSTEDLTDLISFSSSLNLQKICVCC
jgi:hypothetical protein